jgi:hypothetical protein
MKIKEILLETLKMKILLSGNFGRMKFYSTEILGE